LRARWAGAEAPEVFLDSIRRLHSLCLLNACRCSGSYTERGAQRRRLTNGAKRLCAYSTAGSANESATFTAFRTFKSCFITISAGDSVVGGGVPAPAQENIDRHRLERQNAVGCDITRITKNGCSRRRMGPCPKIPDGASLYLAGRKNAARHEVHRWI
jgi:hypothetical protein